MSLKIGVGGCESDDPQNLVLFWNTFLAIDDEFYSSIVILTHT